MAKVMMLRIKRGVLIAGRKERGEMAELVDLPDRVLELIANYFAGVGVFNHNKK